MFCRPLKKLTPLGKVLSRQKMSVSELHIFRLGSQSPILQLLDKAMTEIEKIMKNIHYIFLCIYYNRGSTVAIL